MRTSIKRTLGNAILRNFQPEADPDCHRDKKATVGEVFNLDQESRQSGLKTPPTRFARSAKFFLLLLALAVLSFNLMSEPLWAEDIDSNLMELSKNLAGQITGSKLSKIGVLEFMNNAPGEEVLGGDTGCAGRYMAEVVEEGLFKYARGRYQIVERQKLDKVVKEVKLQISDLVNQDSMKKVYGKISGLDGLVLGTLTRMRDTVKVSVKVVDPRTAITSGRDSTRVKMSPDLAALFGESGYVSPDIDGKSGSAEELLVSLKNNSSDATPNRLLYSPYKIDVIINGKVSSLHSKGDNLYVAAPPGKTYQIELTNNSDRDAAVALLIDGLGTLDQRRDLPSQARKWVVRAGSKARIKGWQIGDKIAKEFVFTGAAESLAARKGFYDNIGLITACFYPEKDKLKTRGLVGTGVGEDIESNIKEVRMEYEKTPAAIVNLHYDLPTIVQKMSIFK